MRREMRERERRGMRKLKLEVRGQEAARINTHVMFGEKMVVVIRSTVADPSLVRGNGSRKEFRPEWKVDIAERMDLSLVSISLREGG